MLAARYGDIYEGINISYVDKYIYSRGFKREYDIELDTTNFVSFEEISPHLGEVQFIFNMMDNELSKHMLDYYLHYTEMYKFIQTRYFSTGCDLNHGLVFTSLIGYQEPYTRYFKETTFEDDAKIETHSCADAAQDATIEQTFDSNSMAANLLVTLFSNCLSKDNIVSTVQIDFTSTDRPYVSSKESEWLDIYILTQVANFFIPKIKRYADRYGMDCDTAKAKEYRDLLSLLENYINIT